MIDPANARGRVIETFQYQAQQAKFSPESVAQLRQVDANRDGSLSVDELRQWDGDGDGQLSAQESAQLAPQDRNVVNQFLSSALEPSLAVFDLGLEGNIETLIEFEGQAGQQVAERGGPVIVNSELAIERQEHNGAPLSRTQSSTELAEVSDNFAVMPQGDPLWTVGVGNTPDRARMSALANAANSLSEDESNTAVLSGYSARTLAASELREAVFTDGRLDPAKLEALTGETVSPEARQRLEVLLNPLPDDSERYVSLMASQPGELSEVGAESSDAERAARAQALADALGPEASGSDAPAPSHQPQYDPINNQRWEQVEQEVQKYKLGNVLGMLGAVLAGAPSRSLGAVNPNYVETVKEKVARPIDPEKLRQQAAEVETEAASDEAQSEQPAVSEPAPPTPQVELPAREQRERRETEESPAQN